MCIHILKKLFIFSWNKKFRFRHISFKDMHRELYFIGFVQLDIF